MTNPSISITNDADDDVANEEEERDEAAARATVAACGASAGCCPEHPREGQQRLPGGPVQGAGRVAQGVRERDQARVSPAGAQVAPRQGELLALSLLIDASHALFTSDNPGNPKAESEFMRIGSAYERLVNGDTHVNGGGGYGGQRQQNPYSRQYQQQQNFYRQQQQYQQYQHQQRGVPVLVHDARDLRVSGLGHDHPPVAERGNASVHAAADKFKQQQQRSFESETCKPEEPRSSPLEQLAKVFAPSIYAFNPIYLNARGRRMLLFFPDDSKHGCSVREQFSVIENLAVEFQRDPLTFCWMDLSTRPAQERKKWDEQFGSTATPSFVVACSAKGRKIVMYPAPSKTSVDELRQWITRLLGGEISQRETIPELFG